MADRPPHSRVLIVDDDEETCRLIAELIADPDRDLQQAHTGDDAIDRAKYEPFDLVISDINLNGPDSGLDVLKAFKRANPQGEVVLISGFGTTSRTSPMPAARKSSASACRSASVPSDGSIWL